MTPVRRPHRPAAGARSRKARDAEPGAGPSRVAQVRLRADEMDALQVVMRTMHLSSTSDALREGLRLLAREASEMDAAADIHAFYAGTPAPLPDGVALPSDEELAAADDARW